MLSLHKHHPCWLAWGLLSVQLAGVTGHLEWSRFDVLEKSGVAWMAVQAAVHLVLQRILQSVFQTSARVTTLFIALVLLVSSAPALAWKPYKAWRDSYAVGGICYCDSSNFDHGIGDVKVLAPDGYQRSVRQICADIKQKYGDGPVAGRIPYNTIACGNGPANNAPDEDLATGCPGRVDSGEAGCFDIGPSWPLVQLYGSPMNALDRSVWRITTSANTQSSSSMADGNGATRWSTNALQAPGQWIEIDLGGLFTVNVVDLDSVGSRFDSPLGWLVETSADRQNWAVAGRGDSTESDAYPTEVTRMQIPTTETRYLRITQTGMSPRNFWSVHELHIGYLQDE